MSFIWPMFLEGLVFLTSYGPRWEPIQVYEGNNKYEHFVALMWMRLVNRMTHEMPIIEGGLGTIFSQNVFTTDSTECAKL